MRFQHLFTFLVMTSCILPVQAESEACYRVGPFNSIDADYWLEQLDEQQLEAWLSEEPYQKLVGEWVLIPTTGSADALNVMVQLDRLGMQDFARLRNGHFTGWISVGIFSKPSGADRRIAQLAPLGREIIRQNKYHGTGRYDVAFRADEQTLYTAGLNPERMRTECPENSFSADAGLQLGFD